MRGCEPEWSGARAGFAISSAPIQAWLTEHPRVHPMPLPLGACWLSFQAGW
jgi:hypothetical protein